MKDFIRFARFEIRFFALLLVLSLLAALCSCHTSKSVTQASATVCDSTSVSASATSSYYDAVRNESLRLMLDSLDIWIYDWPPGGGRVLPADSACQPETPSLRDKSTPKAIHITAKKAALDKSGTTEIHSKNDSLSTSKSTAHSDKSESANTQSDTTAIAKPPNMTWVLIVGIVTAFTIIGAFAFLRLRHR